MPLYSNHQEEVSDETKARIAEEITRSTALSGRFQGTLSEVKPFLPEHSG